MPPAIADSDEEGDDIGAIECEDVVSSARGSRGSRGSGGEGVKGALDGADESSADSTEQLRRQLQSAERGLLSISAPGMNQQNSSASPARQAAKRRHTAAFASEGNVSPQKGLKRTKTLKTYGGSRRQLEPADDNGFDQFRNDDGHAPATSQSFRFSEHSGHQSSMPLPAGSLQTDFLNHEPAVMFKDTGDTVAEASSEQQRQMDQIIASKKAFSTSLNKEVQQEMENQSSSIPWTASDIANSAKSKKAEKASNAANEGVEEIDEPQTTNGQPSPNAVPGAAEPAPSGNADNHIETSHPDLVAKQVEEIFTRLKKSSPVVEIPRQQPEKAAPDEAGTQKTRRNSKGRNKKVEEGSEPLNSDDRAIGLPKERYQPRPSRRRATQIVEEPIDYSVPPEKAAKVKRTKTTGAKDSVATTAGVPDASQDLNPGVSPPGLSKDEKSGDDRKEEDPFSMADTQSTEQDESPIKPRRTIKQQGSQHPPDSSTPAEAQPASPTKPEAAVQKLEQQEDEDKIFVKPAIPTPKPKTSSKAKRAQTTIYEDHVEFLGSRRSPNLSQQQAERKSALQDVDNEVAPKTLRKRKTVVAEDSDDEDELAKDDAVVGTAVSPPKKRRGRPPKSNTQTQAKATDTVLNDADEDEENERAAEADQPENDKPPKKRGRGRPAKAAAKTVPEQVNDASGEKDSKDGTSKPQDTNEHASGAASQPASTPSKQSAPATEIPTPSLEKPIEKMKSTPQKAASSTAQHSPIKSNSKVPLRVGLSKRSRIQPLLRMMKPPKR